MKQEHMFITVRGNFEMSYENYTHKEKVKKIEKLIKQNRAQVEVNNAKDKRGEVGFRRWKKKQKKGGTAFDKKLSKFLREE